MQLPLNPSFGLLSQFFKVKFFLCAKLRGAFEECIRFGCCVFMIFFIYKFKMIQLYSKTLYGVEAFGYEHVDNTINSWPHDSFKVLIAAVCSWELICRPCTQAGVYSSCTASRSTSLSHLGNVGGICFGKLACWSYSVGRRLFCLYLKKSVQAIKTYGVENKRQNQSGT